MSEWFKEHAWKVCIRQKCIRGSNPRLSAEWLNGFWFLGTYPPQRLTSSQYPTGEVAEWFNAPDSKSDVPSRVPGVRLPPSPHPKPGLSAGLFLYYCPAGSFTVGPAFLKISDRGSFQDFLLEFANDCQKQSQSLPIWLKYFLHALYGIAGDGGGATRHIHGQAITHILDLEPTLAARSIRLYIKCESTIESKTILAAFWLRHISQFFIV